MLALHVTYFFRDAMAEAENMGRYYWLIMNGRQLKNNKFCAERETSFSGSEGHTSHNIVRPVLLGVKC